MVKVSVIVPVYNGEIYIKSCLNSIFEQSLKEIQVIVINDGSTDTTQEILEEYKKQYPEIIEIVTKGNEGQGKARNIGIDLAKGEFISFVDADDQINPNMLEKMYNVAKKEQADVIICDYNEIIGDKKIEKKALSKKTIDIKRGYIISVAGPCNKLIRTEILKKQNLRFLDSGIYEDIAMIPLVGVYANKMIYVEEPFYDYYIRQGSTMRQNKFNDKLLSIYPVMDTLTKGFEKSGQLKTYEKEIEFIYIKHLLYAGTGRFLEYKEGKTQVKRIVQIMKTRFPNWRKNQYYKEQSRMFKLNCNIFYSKNLLMISIFQTIKTWIKRGRKWRN